MFKSSRLVLLVVAAFMVFGLSFVACGGDKDKDGDGGDNKPVVCDLPGCGETIGVTATTVKIGTLLPLSNTTATAWGVPLSKGMKAYFDYINAKGGIYGRKIELIVGDSQYVGPVANEAIRKLVEQDGIFAIQGSLGTEAHAAVYQYLEERNIPDMFILAGSRMWIDPIAKNRFVFLVDYETEGRILGKYIGENYDGKKLGILAQNDDFGKEGEAGLKLGVEDSGATMEMTATQYYDAATTDVTAQMQRLKADGAEVIGFYGMPAQAASGINNARTTLSWDVPIVITGVNAAQIVGALAGYDNIAGTVSVSFGYQSDQKDNAGAEFYDAVMDQYSPGTNHESIGLTGFSVAQAMVAVLIQAGPDLTRSGFLDAAESICKYTGGTGISPLSFSPTDHSWNEQEIFVKAAGKGTPEDPFSWVPFGEPITEFEKTKDCKQPKHPEGFDAQPKDELPLP